MLHHSKFLVRYSNFEFRISNLVAARGRAGKSVVSTYFIGMGLCLGSITIFDKGVYYGLTCRLVESQKEFASPMDI